MSLFVSIPARCSLILLASTIIISGCSGSGDSGSGDSGAAGFQSTIDVNAENEQSAIATNDDSSETSTTIPDANNASNLTDESATVNSSDIPDATSGTTSDTETNSDGISQSDPVDQQDGRIVTWDITVPFHVSDELQLRLVWNGQEMPTQYVSGQSWTATGFVPLQDLQPISITFYDRNGSITLGSYEDFYAFTPAYYTHDRTIRANQFETDRYDDDGDGVSNIDELRAGTDPLVHLQTEQPSVDLSNVYNDVIELLAGFQFDQLDIIVQDLVQVIAQETTIIWPDGDYYQVQDTESLTSLCDGGTECQLLPGEYTLVNHTTGENSPLVVSSVKPVDNPEATVLADGSFLIEDDIFTTETAPVQRVQYACENGGSVITELVDATPVRQIVAGTEYRGLFNRVDYQFDQCQVTLRDGPLPDGAYQINGSLLSEFKDYIGWRDIRQSYSYNGFSITADNGLEYRAQGYVAYSHIENANFLFRRDANIVEYYMQPPGAQIGESINDVQYSWDSDSGNTPLYKKYQLELSGSVRHGKTGGASVSVSTPSVMNASVARFDTPTPFNGMIEMQSEDGGVLHLRANPAAVLEAREWYKLYADIDYTGANGSQTSLSRVLHVTPDHNGPDCDIDRVQGMRQLECVEE